MKDLKEKIKKNNMKKLVLSAVLGMFCYCTNNAMNEEPKAPPVEVKNIDDVLNTMLLQQSYILNSKANIENVKGKIYSQIKEKDGKVKKGRVLEFIKNQFTNKEKKQKGFDDNIKKIEQYFHLEGENDNYECTKDNLTEIFWGEVEDKEDILIKDGINIGKYFVQIINAEVKLSEAFKEYYEAEKTTKEENKGVQYEDILKRIMNDCCDKETEGEDIQTKFLNKLTNLCTKNGIENSKGNTVAAIKRRITLAGDIKEEDFLNFLKQKIREEKKEGECCHCCDCF